MRLLIVCSMLLLTTIAHAFTDAEVESALADIVRTTNKTLPSGPEDGRVISVNAGPGRRFNIYALSTRALALWTPALIAESRRIAVDTYCRNPGMQGFRQLNVTVAWQLSDPRGRYVLTNAIAPTECR